MKKIYLIFEDGREILVGKADSLFIYLFQLEEKVILPLSGDKTFTFIRNIYNSTVDQFVSYRSE